MAQCRRKTGCANPVYVEITNGKNGEGYCYEHRQIGFDYNRGMA